jgi:hypothetical protein
MLGQTMYNYDFLNRSAGTNAAGVPALSTDDAAMALQATLQHVVITYDPTNGRRIFINGEQTDDLIQPMPATLMTGILASRWCLAVKPVAVTAGLARYACLPSTTVF